MIFNSPFPPECLSPQKLFSRHTKSQNYIPPSMDGWPRLINDLRWCQWINYSPQRHRDGQRIRGSRKHTFDLDEEGLATLEIEGAKYPDGGIYSCTATNDMGTIESICRVSVSCKQPDITDKENTTRSVALRVVENTSFFLNRVFLMKKKKRFTFCFLMFIFYETSLANYFTLYIYNVFL